jgi:hypothetical protein
VTGFEHDIKPLFREHDRLNMDFVFDLWSYDDVKADAANILDRIEDGTMPCDAPWDAERIQKFRAWMDEGFPE